jgi:hypothetical protein
MRIDGEAFDHVIELRHRLLGGDLVAAMDVEALDATWHFKRHDVLVVFDEPLVSRGYGRASVTAHEG